MPQTLVPQAESKQKDIFSTQDATSTIMEKHAWNDLPAIKFALAHPCEIPERAYKKLTVVLDLDETLVHVEIPDELRISYRLLTEAQKKQFELYVRPGAREFLAFLRSFPEIEIVLWTAGMQTHANRCTHLLGRDFFDAVIAKDDFNVVSWGTVKKLELLLMDGSRTQESILFIDDNEHMCISNLGWNVFKIAPFSPKKAEGLWSRDNALIHLREQFLTLAPESFQTILNPRTEALALVPQQDTADQAQMEVSVLINETLPTPWDQLSNQEKQEDFERHLTDLIMEEDKLDREQHSVREQRSVIDLDGRCKSERSVGSQRSGFLGAVNSGLRSRLGRFWRMSAEGSSTDISSEGGASSSRSSSFDASEAGSEARYGASKVAPVQTTGRRRSTSSERGFYPFHAYVLPNGNLVQRFPSTLQDKDEYNEEETASNSR